MSHNPFLLLLCGSRSLQKIIKFSSFISCYHRLVNRRKLILPLKKYLKNLENMTIDTADTYLFNSFIIFQSGWNNGVEIRAFDTTRDNIFRESYPWHWFYRWSSSSVLWFSYKSSFAGAGNLQIITKHFWCEYSRRPMYCFWTQFYV